MWREHEWRESAVLVLSFAAWCALTHVAKADDCPAQAMIQKIVGGDLAGATDDVRKCVHWCKSAEEKYSPSDKISSNDLIPVLAVGYYQCAQAQMEAETGDLKSAESDLAGAEDTARKWMYSPPNVVGWEDIVDVTEGFLKEKSGHVEEAKQWYLDHPNRYSEIRLGDIALDGSRDSDAREIANQLLKADPNDPHAWIIMGALAEKQGDASSAIADYGKALAQFEKDSNQLLPIYYFDSHRARDGIVRLNQAH